MNASLLPAFALLAIAAYLPPLFAMPPELPSIIGGATDTMEDQAQSPHVAIARELLDILSRTELLLQNCTDAAGVEAALPALRQQRERMLETAEKQRALPDPNADEMKAVNELADTFLSLAEAIGEHMRRLHEANLVSPALEAVMQMPRQAYGEPGEPAETENR